jgi:hypothetical protein
MIVQIEFDEVVHRSVRVHVVSIDVAQEMWAEQDENEEVATWIESSTDDDSGIDWADATFTQVTP